MKHRAHVAMLSLLFALAAAPALATNYLVGSDADLRAAIAAVDGGSGGDTITFANDILLDTSRNADLPAIEQDVLIDGAGHALDGASFYRGFFFTNCFSTLPCSVTQTYTLNVKLQNITIQHTLAKGGNGALYSGGGAGMGGAVFVGKQASVTLSNVSLSANSAIGGAGNGSSQPGGGGGMGGDSGGMIQDANGHFAYGGGGGLGRGADGGNGGPLSAGNLKGADGGSGIALGQSGGGSGGLSDTSVAGGTGGVSGGGGGGGGATNGGSNGGCGAGGGVGGGNGGQGSGGGCNGGNGGFGGGAGLSDFGSNGGFGGGGSYGGNGGYGGGGYSTPLAGGVGGAGAGGAIFVQQGGSLTLAGPVTVNGNTVTGGTGAVNGWAYGSGIYLDSSSGGSTVAATLALTSASGNMQTIADVIADEHGSQLNASGNAALVLGGAGALTLSGANTYAGGTTISGGTLYADNANSATGGGAVTVNGGTLAGSGKVPGAVTLASGSVAPGDAQPSYTVLNLGSDYTQNGGTLAIAVSTAGASHNNSQLAVIGTATLGGELSMTFANVPTAPAGVTVLAAGAIAGCFARITTNLPAGWNYAIDYGTTGTPQTAVVIVYTGDDIFHNGFEACAQ